MADTGRPRVLDDVKRREICALVTAGFELGGAAEYVGCSTSTIRRELKRNMEFRERLRRASLACELDPLNSIRQCARSNWRAAAWYLERVNPERFGKRNPVSYSPAEFQEGFKILIDIIQEEVRSPATRKRIIRQLRQRAGEIEEAATQHAETSMSARPATLKPRSSH